MWLALNSVKPKKQTKGLPISHNVLPYSWSETVLTTDVIASAPYATLTLYCMLLSAYLMGSFNSVLPINVRLGATCACFKKNTPHLSACWFEQGPGLNWQSHHTVFTGVNKLGGGMQLLGGMLSCSLVWSLWTCFGKYRSNSEHHLIISSRSAWMDCRRLARLVFVPPTHPRFINSLG